MDKTVATTTKHVGSCHCGAVRFEAEIDPSASANRCNCSICTKVSPTGAIIKPRAFTLLAGSENLGEYQWGAKISTRDFCKTCGVHCLVAATLPKSVATSFP